MREFKYPNPPDETGSDCVFYENGTYQVDGWSHISYWTLIMHGGLFEVMYKHQPNSSWADGFHGSNRERSQALANALRWWMEEGEFYNSVDSILGSE